MSIVVLPRGRRPEAGTAARQDAHRLAALARDCEAAGIRRRCLVLRLSFLPGELRRPHHLRLARDALDPLLSADRAQRFTLPNHDLAVVWRGTADALLAASRVAVAHMFADPEAPIPDLTTLWHLLDLPADNPALGELIEASLADATPPPIEAPPGEPLDTAALAALEAALAHADVARFARRRTVFTRTESGAFGIAWEVRTLALDDLCRDLAPGRSVRAEPWLLRRLTRTLDRRLLALLTAAEELRSAGPFGLDLNVASILEPDFLRFDEALPTALRGRVTLGLQPADILADPGAFRFARDFARIRGYRLLLELPSGELLAMLPTARLGVDLVQLRWSEELFAVPTDLLDQEEGKILLAGADTGEALAWARAQRITLLEGRLAAPGPTAFALGPATR